MWKEIIDYPGYKCSSDGLVRNIKSSKFLTPITKKGGYLAIRLSKGGKSYERSLHRTIYSAFYGQIADGMHINHKNGLKNDCSVANLEMCTPTENNDKRLFLRRGDQVNTAKLREEDVIDIRLRKSKGESSRKLAEEYGLNKSSINKIVRGYSWKHLPILDVDLSYWGDRKLTGKLSSLILQEKYGKEYFSKISKGNKFKKHCDTCSCTQ